MKFPDQMCADTFECAESWGRFTGPLARDTVQINKMRNGGRTMAITVAESDNMLIKQ